MFVRSSILACVQLTHMLTARKNKKQFHINIGDLIVMLPSVGCL